jgi:LuxR family maltose regulon positive regulatory protein
VPANPSSNRPNTRTARDGPVLQTTKLHAPRFRDGAIRRGRLTSLLQARRCSLALIVAPPGFGKTTLLADWVESDQRPVAWVSIEPQDNDRTVLWTYVTAALSGAIDDQRVAARLSSVPRQEDPAGSLARELEGIASEIVVVLDDYHLIESGPCHDSVMRFAELAPAGIELVVSTRVDPPLPVARLRAAGELLELRTSDLQFTLDETDQFLNRTLGLGLDPNATAKLHARTEGWPAGLYLAYLSLQATPDRKRFLETFGASNRHVVDYLTEQVLMALNPESLEFMLATSIVDSVSGDLADALTDARDSATTLVKLERANVFITPLDERREWYRYHQLLRELLRIELGHRPPEHVAALHQRAAAWYAAHGDHDRTVRHAVAAGDKELAARVISQNYLWLIEWGQIATLVGWLNAVGGAAIEADRRLGVVDAWTKHFLGRHAEGDAALAAATKAPHAAPLPDGASSIESTAALIGAAFPGADVGRMLTSARRAFELESERQSPWRVTVHTQLGFALVRAGQFEEAREPLEIGARLARQGRMWMDAVGAETLLSRIELEAGNTPVAERHARDAAELARAHGIAETAGGAYARAALGIVHVRQGHRAEGERLIADSLPAIRAFGEPLALAEVLIDLAIARRSMGLRAEAAAIEREAAGIVDSAADPGVLRQAVRRPRQPRAAAFTTPLSPRELDVLMLLSRGLSNREVASALFVSYNTVHTHVRAIYRKLNVQTRTEAATRAREGGLINSQVVRG